MADQMLIASRMSDDLAAIEAVGLGSDESARAALLQAITERVGPPPTRRNPRQRPTANGDE
jgi:hypothetical protein